MALLVLSNVISDADAWGAVATGAAVVVVGTLLIGAAILYRKSEQRRQRIRRIRTLKDLLVLTSEDFEETVADLLRALDHDDVHRVGGAGDLNVDVWGRDGQGRRVAVQCKRYSPDHKVGSPEMQTFIGMIYQEHRAGRGYFVTTSTFTEPAAALARRNNIVLIDGERLVDLVEQAGRSSRADGSVGKADFDAA